jgi:hypothetical protein
MTGLISLDEAEAAGSIESDTPDNDKEGAHRFRQISRQWTCSDGSGVGYGGRRRGAR